MQATNAFEVIVEWLERDRSEYGHTALLHEHAYCAQCGMSVQVSQKIVDEVCCYICDVCGRIVDGDSPF
jgi:hypothetical protein